MTHAIRLRAALSFPSPREVTRACNCFFPEFAYKTVRCPNNWAMKPHIESEVNQLSLYLPVRSEMMLIIIWNNSYVNCGCRWKWRVIIAVSFPLKPCFFQASSFQLFKLENSLRVSLFTFIYNRSSHLNYFIYTSHHFKLLLYKIVIEISTVQHCVH